MSRDVYYRDHMGSDLGVVNDARISFASGSKAAGWKPVEIPHPCTSAAQDSTHVPLLSKADEQLIGFLARGCRSGQWEEALEQAGSCSLSREEAHELLSWAKRLPPHWTPFGQQTIKLRMKAPVPNRTQCFKHKIGFVENEESRRYIKSTPELFIPEFRSAPEGDIKQGSAGKHPRATQWAFVYSEICNDAIATYERMINDRVAPEQARYVLPQGVYVNWVWTGSLFAYAEFFNKRADPHTQLETQRMAHQVADIIEPLFPVSWPALTR